MSIVTRDVWHCDECGHEWTITAGVVPEQCASKKCRTRKWNSGMVLERPEPVRQKEPEPVKVEPVKERKPACTKPGHEGFWRSDGYWCMTCVKLYRVTP
ncbi:MAG: hypothetical protein B7Z80_08700 [Rhodospirillales bacterium 20-64-7]|nr:MAG: hypothetical protein B7Z80_08700 [Rhodospirillales bacterium 20-64-7]